MQLINQLLLYIIIIHYIIYINYYTKYWWIFNEKSNYIQKKYQFRNIKMWLSTKSTIYWSINIIILIIRNQINLYDLSKKEWKRRSSLFLSIRIRQIEINQRKKSYTCSKKKRSYSLRFLSMNYVSSNANHVF